MEYSNSNFEKILLQGFLILVLTTVIIAAVRIVKISGFEWQIGSYGLYAFVLLNPCLGLTSNNWINYTKKSVVVLFALSIDLVIITTLFSGIQLAEIKSSASCFLIPIMIFPFVVLICHFFNSFLFTKEDKAKN